MLKIINGTAIGPAGLIPRASVLMDDGKILEISNSEIDAPRARIFDAENRYVSPGFIDIHVHGGGGYDFMDSTVEAFLGIAEMHLRYGTTSMVPTTLTSDKVCLLKTLSVYDAAKKQNLRGAQFIGMHLEGPYFAMNQRGAQDPRFIRDPDPAEYEDIVRQSKNIVRWSAAPELKGALDFGRFLKKNGILPAIAHTDATYEEILPAVDAGFSLVTHLYSGMAGVTRRNAYRFAGTVESALLIDSLDVELIADGSHLPAPLLKLAYKIKGPASIALITDAMRAAGMPAGESLLGSASMGLKVIVEDGVAKLPDRSAFAGSVATANDLVRNMVHLAGIPLIEALKMITSTPARIMGVEAGKGSLSKGKDADIVIFDENVNIYATIVSGEILYSAPAKQEFLGA